MLAVRDWKVVQIRKITLVTCFAGKLPAGVISRIKVMMRHRLSLLLSDPDMYMCGV